MKEYYKLKYLVTESFYEDMFYEKENYTFGQTASKCFVDFCIPSRENEMNFLIVTSTILARLATHEPKELKYFLKKYKFFLTWQIITIDSIILRFFYKMLCFFYFYSSSWNSKSNSFVY